MGWSAAPRQRWKNVGQTLFRLRRGQAMAKFEATRRQASLVSERGSGGSSAKTRADRFGGYARNQGVSANGSSPTQAKN
jgi:hypothetical protein